MSDIKTSSKTLNLRAQASGGAAPAPSAAQLHGQQVGTGVLDLRAKPAVPTPVPATPTSPPQPTAVQVPQASAPSQETAPAPPPAANTVTNISHDVRSRVTAPEPAPTPLVTPRSTFQGSDIPRSSAIQKLPTPPIAAATPAQAMPTAVASQIDTMRSMIATSAPASPQSPALQEALSAAKQPTTPSMVKIAAAIAAVAIMSGLIWLQNSPKLAFHNAASKAGIEASLPTYIPSSYHQKGGVQVADGQLSLNFSSPSINAPLTITQRRTNWDSNSLRDNYVSRQTDSYVSVQGQGLVIYLYQGQASWVNHGVWYQIAGTSKLSPDEVIKIAYGL